MMIANVIMVSPMYASSLSVGRKRSVFGCFRFVVSMLLLSSVALLRMFPNLFCRCGTTILVAALYTSVFVHQRILSLGFR